MPIDSRVRTLLSMNGNVDMLLHSVDFNNIESRTLSMVSLSLGPRPSYPVMKNT